MQGSFTNQSDAQVLEDPQGLIELFDRAEDIPTLPEVSARLLSILHDPDSSASDAAKIIEQDPAISVKVLKICNSVLYAPINSREISSLQLAISRMGFVAVSNIAISTSVFGAFRGSDKPVFNRYEFWRHSVCVGIVASILYETVSDFVKSKFTRENVHLAGIVHDVGKILFERYANAQFSQAVREAIAKNDSLLDHEQDHLGIGHHQAGAYLAERWRLGEDIKQVIQWHHDPQSCPNDEHRDLVKLIHVADYICHKLNLGRSGNPLPVYDVEVLAELHVTGETITNMIDPIKEQTEKSKLLLSLAL